MNAAFFSLAGPKGDNQDAVLAPLLCGEAIFFAVADGVGGSELGSLASSTAISEIKRRLPNYNGNAEDLFNAARRAVIDASEGKDAATTLTFVNMKDNVVEVAHVGDSRLYHLRHQGLITRTADQTEIAELVRQGVFSAKEAQFYRRKNVIISAISSRVEFDLQRSRFDVIEGDLIVACTDGVYNAIQKKKFIELNIEHYDAKDYALALRQAVENAGPSDDYSCVVFRA